MVQFTFFLVWTFEAAIVVSFWIALGDGPMSGCPLEGPTWIEKYIWNDVYLGISIIISIIETNNILVSYGIQILDIRTLYSKGQPFAVPRFLSVNPGTALNPVLSS